jgi:hypothetical protein
VQLLLRVGNVAAIEVVTHPAQRPGKIIVTVDHRMPRHGVILPPAHA